MVTLRSVALRAGLLLAAIAIAAAAHAQDWKAGTGRLEGQVFDADGKPIEGATVKLELKDRGGTEVKTDKKGKWAILGLTGGPWSIEVRADGYVGHGTVKTVMQDSRLAPVVFKLEKAKAAGPPAELVAANEKAEAAYGAGRWAEAREEYEKLIALRPDLAPKVRTRIAFTYVQEKEFAKAVEQLKQVLEADPSDSQVRALAAQAALEGGLVDEAKTLLAPLDDSKIKEPDVFFNLGVSFLKAGKNEEAVSFFTKSVTLDPNYVDGYYRRALSYLALGKTAESRADFEKVVQLAPATPEGEMAKKALSQLK